MPALPTVVSDYLDAVKSALQQGSDLGQNVRGAAQNYLRAQDMATVLDLLQQSLTTGSLTATGGTSRSVQDGAATFVVGSQVGNVVVFDGNTTAALAGIEARVVSNTATELFFLDTLPASPASGDTYTVRGAMFDDAISSLREGKGLANSPAGNVYGDSRVALASLLVGVERVSGTAATERSMASLTTVAGSTTTVLELDDRGVGFRIDEFRGYKVTVSGEARIVLQNDEDSMTLTAPLSSAPAASTAVAVTVPFDDFGGTSAPKLRVHPGAQPGENVSLADLIDQLEVAVVAFTLPT